MSEQKRVSIIGGGKFATTIARLIATNVVKHEMFFEDVLMFVYHKITEDGQTLCDVINETHENVEYLPGVTLPDNVIAIPDLVECAKDADILVFIIPQQYLKEACHELQGKIKPTASGLSLIKGFDATDDDLELFSHLITRVLKIQVSVLMGALLCDELVKENFGEITIGCRDKNLSLLFKELMQTSYLRVVLVEDAEVVEICGALRNIVACGVGFVQGLGLGNNAKAAVIRVGLLETIKFVDTFYPGGRLSTFFESCGVGDLLTTYYPSRHCRISEVFVKTGEYPEELDEEILQGNKLDGLLTAEKVTTMIRNKDMEDKFPFMTSVHKIYNHEIEPPAFLDAIKGHPAHRNVRLVHLTW